MSEGINAESECSFSPRDNREEQLLPDASIRVSQMNGDLPESRQKDGPELRDSNVSSGLAQFVNMLQAEA